jgi:hypothetical protein
MYGHNLQIKPKAKYEMFAEGLQENFDMHAYIPISVVSNPFVVSEKTITVCT